MGVRLGNGNWGVKANKLLAYNDASGMFFNKEFDFTRATAATRVNKSGLIEIVDTNIPRIDFTDDTKGHLLLEPASTNKIVYSQNFNLTGTPNSGTGRQNNATTSPSSLPSPDGGTNAFTFIYDGTFNASIRKIVGVDAGEVITMSIFLKKTADTPVFSADTDIRIGMFNNLAANVGLNLGNAINAAPVGEWRRYSLSATGDSDGGQCVPNVRCDVAASIDAFGWQVETNSFATSYIPTSGSTVTRNAETCESSGAIQDFNPTEGVLYMEVAALKDDLTSREISISDSSAHNRVSMFFGGTSDRIRAEVKVGNSTAFNAFTSSFDIENFNKIAIRYKALGYEFYLNGSRFATNHSQSLIFSFNKLDSLNFLRKTLVNKFYGKAREVRTYTTALTEAELIALTT